MILLTAEGSKNGSAYATEVWLLGAINAKGQPVHDVRCVDHAWELSEAHVSFGLAIKSALKAERGSLEIRDLDVVALYLLRHPWSGKAKITTGKYEFSIDLYGETTSVLRFDLSSHKETLASKLEILEFLVNEENCSNEATNSDEGAEATNHTAVKLSLTACSLESSVRLLFAGPTIQAKKLEWESIALASSNWKVAIADTQERPFGDLVFEGRMGRVDLPDLTKDAVLVFARGPNAGSVAIRKGNGERILNLQGPQGLEVVTIKDIDAEEDTALLELSRYSHGVAGTALERLDVQKPIALYVPRWKGVAMSTRCLFEQTLAFPSVADGHPDDVCSHDIERYAEALLRSGGRHFVVSGGDLFWIEIIRRVHKLDDTIRFDLLWHSNFAQMGEPHDWKLWSAWLSVLRDGTVRKVGVVKEGYDTFLRTMGIDAIFVPNVIPTKFSTRGRGDSSSVGLWLSGSSNYRKPVYPSLLAISKVGRYSLQGAGLGRVGMRLASRLGIRVGQVSCEPVNPNLLYRGILSTCVTLYVTLSECSPILPLESLALGVPCLVGPSSHLFREHEFLRHSLVVSNPLDPSEIAHKLEAAHANSSLIIDAYQKYAEAELAKAQDAIAYLLE